MAWGYDDFRPYVRVRDRLAAGRKQVAKMLKRPPAPVEIEGRHIAKTFWGRAWCENLERYSDFATRLPRGRTYVRNGSVLDLAITPGTITALVAGTEVYTITITLRHMAPARWRKVIAACSGRIGSLIGLLKGELSKDVLDVIARADTGLFPTPAEIEMSCSCPDWAVMCKHVAATLYGVGARLDQAPELFFTLRQVDQAELLAQPDAAAALARRGSGRKTVPREQLAELFGIDLDVKKPRKHGR